MLGQQIRPICMFLMTHLLNVRTALVTAARWWFLEAALKWHFNLTNFFGWFNLAAPLTPICSTQTLTKRMHQTCSHDRLFVNVFVCALEVCMCGFMHMCEWLFVYVGVCVGSEGEAASSAQKKFSWTESITHMTSPEEVCVCLCLCALVWCFTWICAKLFSAAFKRLQPKKMSSNTAGDRESQQKINMHHNVLLEIN